MDFLSKNLKFDSFENNNKSKINVANEWGIKTLVNSYLLVSKIQNFSIRKKNTRFHVQISGKKKAPSFSYLLFYCGNQIVCFLFKTIITRITTKRQQSTPTKPFENNIFFFYYYYLRLL